MGSEPGSLGGAVVAGSRKGLRWHWRGEAVAYQGLAIVVKHPGVGGQ